MISAVGSSSTSTTASSTVSASTSVSSDFNTFLKMLTAQLKNQDPLNPMEGTEFAVQLATFSGVEQQAQTNKLLASLVERDGGTGLVQSANLIGKEARTTEPVWFGDEALTLDIKPDALADDVVLVTVDESGKEVTRESIGPGTGEIAWYGRDAMGDKLADGLYSFRIESLRAGEIIAEADVASYARIVEAQTGEDGIDLILAGGSSVPASEIQALRDQ